VPESSKKEDAAKKFVEWATSKEYIQLVGQTDGWVSAPPGTRQSTYDNKQYLDAAPFAKFVEQAIETADPVNTTKNPKPYIGVQFAGIPELNGRLRREGGRQSPV
jgi:sorbitol/mannitol transport system substrate-binding protein